ncbi:MAG: cob(I)yrinic acid a,c-diamide adenosyltransferase [Glaciecola sp.]
MKIYTKQGDTGTTSVYSKTILKVNKDDAIIECYGTLDELNAQLGLIAALLQQEENSLQAWASHIQTCQQHIFAVGFALSDEDKLSPESIQTLEQHIDAMQSALPPQTSFILPGGSVLSAHLHIARTVARRGERALVTASHHHATSTLALAYINRLSDFLFVLARTCNFVHEIEDIKV